MTAIAVQAPALPPRTLNLIVGLIRGYMGLAADQVVVYNQKWKIPADDRLYVSVGYLAQKVYGSTRMNEEFVDGDRTGLKEVAVLNSQETLTINLYSRGEAAIARKDELLLAFGGNAAQQLCEANSMKIGQLPLAMTDVSGIEGTAILNRFVATINLLVARRQERIIRYYDTFPTPALVINP